MILGCLLSAYPSSAEHRVFLEASCPCLCASQPGSLAAWQPGTCRQRKRGWLLQVACWLGQIGESLPVSLQNFAPFAPVPAPWDGLRLLDPSPSLSYQLVIKTTTNTQTRYQERICSHACGTRTRPAVHACPVGGQRGPEDGSRYRLRLVAQGTPGLGHHSSVRAWDGSMRPRHAIPIGICGPAGTSSGIAFAPVRLALPAARPICLDDLEPHGFWHASSARPLQTRPLQMLMFHLIEMQMTHLLSP